MIQFYFILLLFCFFQNSKSTLILNQQKPNIHNLIKSSIQTNFDLIFKKELIQSILKDLSLEIANGINAYTTSPTQSGSKNGISYRFENFIFNTFFGTDIVYNQLSAERLHIRWQNLEFVQEFRYHICSKVLASQAHVCEDGYIEILTIKPVPVDIEMDLNLSGVVAAVSNIKASITNVTTRNDIDVRVSCTNLVCLIPVHDIAQNVWDQFPTVFAQAVEEGIQYTVKKYPLKLIESFDKSKMDFQGYWSIENQNIVLKTNGITGTSTNWSPKMTAPSLTIDSKLKTNPPATISILMGKVFLNSALWTMNELNFFKFKITNADLPSSSPFHLVANDPALTAFAPGLKKFGNQTLFVNVALPQAPTTLNPSTNLTMSLSFIVNKTNELAFEFQTIVSFKLNPIDITQHNKTFIEIKVGVSNWSSFKSTIIHSNVGQVLISAFDSMLGFFVDIVDPQPSPVLLPIPSILHGISNVHVSSPSIPAAQQPYLLAIGDAPPLPHVPSNDCHSFKCALRNTCCASGCCPLEKAECCGNGCCPQGTICCNGGSECCYQNK